MPGSSPGTTTQIFPSPPGLTRGSTASTFQFIRTSYPADFAAASMNFASFTSRAVRPDASWVDSTMSTRL